MFPPGSPRGIRRAGGRPPPARARRLLGRLVLLAAACHARAAAATDISVQVIVTDSLGAFLPACVHVRDALNRNYPAGPDSLRFSHDAGGHMRGYFYTGGSFDMTLPAGQTQITVGRGFEWRPLQLSIDLQRDTTLALRLEKPFDLRGRGWYGGDAHVHMRHEPLDYDISPGEALLISRAEDLSIAWCLDQDHGGWGWG